ncbi:MAG: universal stress protein, partial [Spirochaetes bacterium]
MLEEPSGKAIVEAAKIEKIDLIIMGTKGKTDLEGLIMGSTTHRVL